MVEEKRGHGADEFAKAEDGQAPKRGRPAVYVEPRSKLSFLIRDSLLTQLEAAKREERERLAAAGKPWRQVSLALLLDEAITLYLTEKDKGDHRSRRQAKTKRRRR